MAKYLLTLSASLLTALSLAPLAPASAQQGTRIREIEVFGNDPCPRSTDSEIWVCARKKESDRFRIPERLRPGGDLQQRTAWANKAKAFETYGRTGINSCSPVGPAGFTGCTEQLIKQAEQERKEQTAADTAP